MHILANPSASRLIAPDKHVWCPTLMFFGARYNVPGVFSSPAAVVEQSKEAVLMKERAREERDNGGFMGPI